jgi:hypothetical protein
MQMLRNNNNFWQSLLAICQFCSQKISDELSHDISAVQSIVSVISILAVDMYNVNYLRNQQVQAKKQNLPFEEIQYPNLVGIFINNGELMRDLLQLCITFIMTELNEGSVKVTELDHAVSHQVTSRNVMLDLTNYIVDIPTATDEYYDIRRMRRWEGPKNEPITKMCEELNIRFALTDAHLALLKGLHSINAVAIIAVHSEEQFNKISFKNYIGELLDILLTGMRVTHQQYGSIFNRSEHREFKKLSIGLPLPYILDTVLRACVIAGRRCMFGVAGLSW